MKLIFDKAKIKKAENDIDDIITNIIQNKSRSSDGKKIKSRTGKLIKSIDPLIIINNNTISLNTDVIEYYKYLDKGTNDIEPWFFTEDIMNNKKILDIIKSLYIDAYKRAVSNSVKKLNKT